MVHEYKTLFAEHIEQVNVTCVKFILKSCCKNCLLERMTAYGHYFNEETKEIHAKTLNNELDDRGVGYVLFHSMKKSAEIGLIAQIDAETAHRDSFKSVLIRSIRLAIKMKEMGLKKGDVITICSYNHLHSSVPYLAGHFLGLTIAPTDPTISVDDQRHLMNLVKPKLIFVSNGSEEMLTKALSTLKFKYEIITFARNKSNQYKTFASMVDTRLDAEDSFEPVVIEDPTATCVILFSSGTTGLPKGICLNHYFIMGTINNISAFKIEKPRFLIYSSLYWISAVMFQTSCFYSGMERIVCSHFDPKLIGDYIGKYKIKVAFLAPIQAIKSIPYLEKNNGNSSLKMCIMGGSAIAPNYMQSLRDALPSCLVINAYGQTEVGFISMFPKRDDNYNKLNSVGVLTSNRIAKIVDPETNEPLPLNQEGEFRIKVPYPMNGYYNQNSSLVWDEDGFIKTGDLGYFDDDLCLFLTDRIKEMFKYESWHIVPAKLEAILQSHPAVELAIVVGISHPTEDNHAAAGVTLMAGASVTANELEQYVEDRVDERNRLRAGVIILDQMPLTPSGKIMRRQAKEILKGLVKLRT